MCSGFKDGRVLVLFFYNFYFFYHLQKTWSSCNWKCINVECLCDACNPVLENREYHV